ncbi:MAG TPA: pilus assembly protein, partial [Bryobacteraceae bacterium]|nr:pilus assembly protein [Bryobacteraceae bacterium]
MNHKSSDARRPTQKGAETLEMALVLVPMLGFLFLIIDIGWAVFTKGTLQHAVREGVRFGVTSRTLPGMGHRDSIRSVVVANSLGLLKGKEDLIHIEWYSQSDLGTPLKPGGSTPINSGDNIIEVSVEGFAHSPLLPLYRTGAPLFFTARSSDRM